MTYIQDTSALKANFKKARILVVEDNDDYWMLIQRSILQTLPEVVPVRATTSVQAIDLLRQWERDEFEMPKMVLLDLYLPKRTQGWQVLADIKGLSTPFNQVPVIMLSGSDTPGDISEAYRRGAASYVVKPLAFADWIAYFKQLRTYWWETVRLPQTRLAM